MKRKQIILWAMLSIFLVVNTPILATSLQKINQIPSADMTREKKFDQKDLLFQTILDIANNKEIQRIILKFQMSIGIFPTSDIPVLMKNHLKQMYLIGLIFSKFISKSRMQSIVEKYQFSNQETQKEINGVIEKDATLNAKITQLPNSECDCENEINEEKISTTDFSDTPIICMFLLTVILGTGFFLSFDILMLILFPFALLIWIICSIAFSLYDIFGCGPEDPKNSS